MVLALLALTLAGCAASDEPTGGGADAAPASDEHVDASVGGADAASDDTCDPSCTGCCMDGQCMEGTSTDACGYGGAECVVCGESEVCGGACGLDPDARYDMVLLDGAVDSTKVSGSSWDINGGKPDVKLHGWTPYVESIASSTRGDTIAPDWMGEVVAEGSRLHYGFVLWVDDDDGIDDDFVCQLLDCPVSPVNTTLECSAVRGTESESEYDGKNAGCTIHYRIVPH